MLVGVVVVVVVVVVVAVVSVVGVVRHRDNVSAGRVIIMYITLISF